MDREFDRRLLEGVAPFDGRTVSSESEGSIETLRAALLAVFEVLHGGWGDRELLWFADWIWHDDYLGEASPMTWERVRLALSSDEALIGTCQDNDHVFTAVFPESREWYLRFGGHRDYDFKAKVFRDYVGEFDLTGHPDLVAMVAERLTSRGIATRVSDPDAFFQRHRPR
jgi:hypothetical protein